MQLGFGVIAEPGVGLGQQVGRFKRLGGCCVGQCFPTERWISFLAMPDLAAGNRKLTNKKRGGPSLRPRLAPPYHFKGKFVLIRLAPLELLSRGHGFYLGLGA